MKVFVTGATGFVGSAVVQELIGAGYEVLGLARSDVAAKSLAAAGAEVCRGTLEDLSSLRSGAAMSDGVIHTAFNHDFSNFADACEKEQLGIEAIGATLAGSNRPFVVTSGTALLGSNHIATEEDMLDPKLADNWPRKSEEHALALLPQRVCVSVVRLPPSVHGDGDHGFVPRLIRIAREKGVSAYVSSGSNRWAAVHRLDAARLFRLAFEKAQPGAILHAVGDEGVPFRDIATVIGKRLNLPVLSKSQEEASDHFGFLGLFAAMDIPASSARTQQQFGWHPTQPGLIADLDRPTYFETETISSR